MPPAQIKSAVLLAGLAAPGTTTVIETEASRDHTELMLMHFGADVKSEPEGPLWAQISLTGQPELSQRSVAVPADPSSAAFPMVAALLVPGSDIFLPDVMTNPLRTGLITTLREMGAVIVEEELRHDGGEAMAGLRVRYSALRGVEVPPQRAPAMIDEYPILAVAAAFATWHHRDARIEELRVKESDRLAATADMLRVNGICRDFRRRSAVRGRGHAEGGPRRRPMDHRIAMARCRPCGRQARDGDDASLQRVSGLRRPDAPGRSPMIIAIDGPAASGKGTLGKRLAAHYGLRHLDTGLLYRAVAQAVLDSGHRLDDAARAAAAAQALDPAQFDEAALKSHAAGEAASVVSAIPEVRAALFRLQQDFAAVPPGAVLDGRDIGTVICPFANAKIFVTASPEVRARRRAIEMRRLGQIADEIAILADIRRRDERDSQRTLAPLKPAPDAHILDTSELDIDAVVREAIAIGKTRSGVSVRKG